MKRQTEALQKSSQRQECFLISKRIWRAIPEPLKRLCVSLMQKCLAVFMVRYLSLFRLKMNIQQQWRLHSVRQCRILLLQLRLMQKEQFIILKIIISAEQHFFRFQISKAEGLMKTDLMIISALLPLRRIL